MSDLTQSNPPKATWLQTMLAQSKQAPAEAITEQPAMPASAVPERPDIRTNQTASQESQSDIESMLTFGTEGQPFASGPDSGSIMKVLSATPGIRERITQGIAKGHTFQIIHMPGSPNFFLCENWDEDQKDQTTGQVTKVPKKRYDPFMISDMAPAPVVTPAPAPEPTPVITQPEPELAPAPVQLPVAEPAPEIAKPIENTPTLQPLQAAPSKEIKEGASSYDLLRSRFAKQAPSAPSSSKTFEAPKDPSTALLEEVYAGNDSEWKIVQEMPFQAFLYPERFAWGTNADGTSIERTLDQYPPASRKLRDKLVPVLERLKNQGNDTDVMQVIDAVRIASASNIL